MAMWFYQLSEEIWPTTDYRFEVWEGEKSEWGLGPSPRLNGLLPQPGDTVALFYAKTGCDEPGFYGIAVIIRVYEQEGEQRIYFRPCAPSDRLKIWPWWDGEVIAIADEIRQRANRGRFWSVSKDVQTRIEKGIHRWVGGAVPKSI